MRERQERPTLSVKRVALAALIGLMLIVVLLFGAAILIQKEILPENGLRLYALAAAFLGGLLAAFFAAGNRQKLPAALLTSVLLLVVILAGGSALFSGVFDGRGFWALLAVMMASGVSGAFLSGVLR